MKIGVADYGMMMRDGGLFDYEQRCPDCRMILDTGHLNAAGGDSLEIIEKYFHLCRILLQI